MTKKLGTTTVIEQLVDARDLLEKGWCQKAFKAANKHGRYYCIVGAVNEVTGYYKKGLISPSSRRAMLKSLRDALGVISPYGEDETWLIEFNDEKGRKKEHVLNLFNRAIAREMGVPEL